MADIENGLRRSAAPPQGQHIPDRTAVTTAVASASSGDRRRLVYEEWQGNEQFFCWGRCVAGPNWKSLLGTTALILPPLVVYVIFVGEVLEREISIALPAVGAVLGLLSLVFLYRTGCMDPGILPRQDPDDDYRAGRKPKSKDVIVNGHKVMVRYNETCHFYQPPRAHHCSVNDNCVEKFDHHCPWVGTTIGLRNYPWFLMFIFTASSLCLYVCATGVLAIKLEFDDLKDEADAKDESEPSTLDAFREAPAAVALSAYTALFFLFVGGLSFFHMYLVSTNQTTYENFRYGYDRARNPYDLGCLRNWASVCCAPTPPSKIDFRAPVNPTTAGSAGSAEGDSSRQHHRRTVTVHVRQPPPPQHPPQQRQQRGGEPHRAGSGASSSSGGGRRGSSSSRGRQLQLQQQSSSSLGSRRRDGGDGGHRRPAGGNGRRREQTGAIDVELGPMEIRHNPEGGGKLQIVHQISSKELQQAAGSPSSLSGSRSSRSVSTSDVRVQVRGHETPKGTESGR